MEPHKQTEQTPQTPETAERTRYSVIADQLIDAAEKSDDEGRLEGMRHFVGELRQEALGGYIKDSKGESYAPDVFDTQLLTFADELNKSEDERRIKNPVMLIPRSEGLREAFAQLKAAESTRKPLLDAISEVGRGIEVQQVRERLAQAAHEVGGRALHALEVKPVEAPSTTNIDYDAFLNGTYEDGSVEAAAIRPVESEADKLARERRIADAEDAARKAYKRPEMN